MSIPLKDFRLAIPEGVDIWLDAVATATGKDKAAVARDVLKGWAKQKDHEHKVAGRRFAANGMQPELMWDEPEDDGASRNTAAGRR